MLFAFELHNVYDIGKNTFTVTQASNENSSIKTETVIEKLHENEIYNLKIVRDLLNIHQLEEYYTQEFKTF